MVLQRLNHEKDDSQAKDYLTISQYLSALGWKQAKLFLTAGNQVAARDKSGKYWLAYEYLQATPGQLHEGDKNAYTKLARLLGKLHADLKQLRYQPLNIDPYFHNSQHYQNKLQQLGAEVEEQQLVKEVLKQVKMLRISSIHEKTINPC